MSENLFGAMCTDVKQLEENEKQMEKDMKNEKKGVKMIMYMMGILLILVAVIVIFFKLPMSKTNSEFNQKAKEAITKQKIIEGSFTGEDIKDLPEPLRQYFHYCGFMRMKKPTYMKIAHKDVDFIQSGKSLKMEYIQYNFTKEPERIAYINSSLMGIPFQGLDHYLEGNGGMKGIIAKTICLFNVQGKEMNAAGLVTCLAEGILLPSFILQDYITWESIDNSHVKGTIDYYGLKVSGIFTFKESGEVYSFYTSDRILAEGNTNTMRAVDWECIVDDYREVNGIKSPNRLKAIWHEEQGDLVYFDSDQFKVTYY